jgi:hypothetical protein
MEMLTTVNIGNMHTTEYRDRQLLSDSIVNCQSAEEHSLAQDPELNRETKKFRNGGRLKGVLSENTSV